MKRFGYVGSAPVAGSGGSALGLMGQFTSDPGSKWINVLDWTESEVKLLRKLGALAPTTDLRGVSPSSTNASGGFGTNNTNVTTANQNRRGYAACPGRGQVVTTPLVNNTGSAPVQGGYLAHFNAACTYSDSSGLIYGDVSQGISFIEQTKEIITLFNNGATYGSYTFTPPTRMDNSSGSIYYPAGTRRTTGPGAGYTQVRQIGGKYVACSAGGLGTGNPKYSADLVNWSDCVVPALNNANAGTENYIAWIEYDAANNRLVGMTKYGEILVTTDGVTWTKTVAKAAAGAAFGLDHFTINQATGKLWAIGSGGLYSTPNTATALTAVAVTPPSGWTLAGTPGSVGSTFGVIGITCAVGTAPAGSASVAYSLISLDDGATWTTVSSTQALNTQYVGHAIGVEGVMVFATYEPTRNWFGANPVYTDGERYFASLAKFATGYNPANTANVKPINYLRIK